MHIYRRLPSVNVGNTLWRMFFFAFLLSAGMDQLLFKNRSLRLNGAVKVTERITRKDRKILDQSKLLRKKPRLFNFKLAVCMFTQRGQLDSVQLWICPSTMQIFQIVHRCDSSCSFVSLHLPCDLHRPKTAVTGSTPLWPCVQMDGWKKKFCIIAMLVCCCTMCLAVNLIFPLRQ